MESSQLIFLSLLFLVVGSAFLSIALIFYIGRTRVKEIDKAVYGFEMLNDSIFFLVFRVPTYGFAFLWKRYAKIVGCEGKIEHFDRHFRRPFIIVAVLTIFGSFMMIIALLFREYVGIG